MAKTRAPRLGKVAMGRSVLLADAVNLQLEVLSQLHPTDPVLSATRRLFGDFRTKVANDVLNLEMAADATIVNAESV